MPETMQNEARELIQSLLDKSSIADSSKLEISNLFSILIAKLAPEGTAAVRKQDLFKYLVKISYYIGSKNKQPEDFDKYADLLGKDVIKKALKLNQFCRKEQNFYDLFTNINQYLAANYKDMFIDNLRAKESKLMLFTKQQWKRPHTMATSEKEEEKKLEARKEEAEQSAIKAAKFCDEYRIKRLKSN